MERELARAGREVLLVLGALLPIVNPLGNAPIFLAITSWASTEVRCILARRVAVNAFALLMISIFVGSHILAIFGISLPIVQVGGGLLVAASGWRLLEVNTELSVPIEKTSWTSDEVIERAFFPLTFPLTVGPGSVSVAIALGANTVHWQMPLGVLIAVVLLATALIAASIYLLLSFRRHDAASYRRERHEDFSEALRLHPALHRTSDHLERHHRVDHFFASRFMIVSFQ